MQTSAPTRFPTVGLAVLAGAIFVSVTGEFLPTGLLPDMARDLGVSEAQIGLLVSVFAATVVVATAPLAALTRNYSRKRLVVVVLGLNALATIGAAIAPSYELLIGARIVGGLAHGLFWAIVGSYSAHLVPKHLLPRAVAITAAGGSAAFVLGVPLGTALGHALGWRLAFTAIAAAMLVLAALLLFFLPPVDHRVSLATGEIPLPTRRDPTLVVVLGTCVLIVLAVGGQNIFYTYVAPFIIGPVGFDPTWVSPLLFLYGGAGAIGLVVSGMVAGKYPVQAIVTAVGVSALALVLLALTADVPWIVVVLLVLWGLVQGSLAPLFQTRMMQIASPRIRDLASAWMTTSFNIGIGGGALVGAGLLESAGLLALPYAAAGVMLLGIVAVIVLHRLTRPTLTRSAKRQGRSTRVNATHPTSL
ncbi:MFS transporter [Herbiconiux sp. L3-i23]|uniref:MFS transporter n=1 Tax=Herbiconiux sp. L3-i23 TaxID=2905871 RepID=UPI002049C007|nr:MFS transporter [Herbiconiux sp. L3-i23]BDI23785.1 MFS transporter [Herbiconiux sp. L3-i23]